MGAAAVYIAFGRTMGYMGSWTDVHGARAQRSDPKSGNPDDYPYGRGPQGDAIRIYNYVRLVRDAIVETSVPQGSLRLPNSLEILGNPSGGSLTVQLSLAKDTRGELSVYDVGYPRACPLLATLTSGGRSYPHRNVV